MIPSEQTAAKATHPNPQIATDPVSQTGENSNEPRATYPNVQTITNANVQAATDRDANTTIDPDAQRATYPEAQTIQPGARQDHRPKRADRHQSKGTISDLPNTQTKTYKKSVDCHLPNPYVIKWEI